MSKICGYSCEHNKSGVCQISGCDKKSIILDYTIAPNSDIKPLLDKLEQENKQLKDNWNMLKEYIRKNIIYDDVGMKILDPSPLEDYMQELEQGSDSNE